VERAAVAAAVVAPVVAVVAAVTAVVAAMAADAAPAGARRRRGEAVEAAGEGIAAAEKHAWRPFSRRAVATAVAADAGSTRGRRRGGDSVVAAVEGIAAAVEDAWGPLSHGRWWSVDRGAARGTPAAGIHGEVSRGNESNRLFTLQDCWRLLMNWWMMIKSLHDDFFLLLYLA
jgi:hypothetical protein